MKNNGKTLKPPKTTKNTPNGKQQKNTYTEIKTSDKPLHGNNK